MTAEPDLVGDPDARHWAERFTACTAIAPELATQFETMVVWFAAAIETGRQHARRPVVTVQPSARCREHGTRMRLQYSPQRPDGEWVCGTTHPGDAGG